MKLNKKQKRTATIASMAALLAVVLGMGGQTFAKYITTATVPAQNATVAKWGVITTVSGTNTTDKTAFRTDYDNVASADTDFVVAPGTTGSLILEIGGTPEVSAQVSIDMNVTQEVHLDTYYPITWTLKVDSGAEETYNANRDTSMKDPDSSKGIAAAVSGLDYTYDVDAGPAPVLAKKIVLTWNWDFDDNGAGTYDTIDTALGDYASTGTLPSGYTSGSYQLAFTISLKITQID